MSTPPCPPEINSLADLEQVQRLMGETIFRPLTKHDGMQTTWTDGRPMTEVVAGFMKPNGRMSGFERLEIYNRQYWFRLLDCLHDDYPGLRALLGQRKFGALCQAYLTKYPSESFSLRNLGTRLETFMREEPQWAGAKLGMALDIVRFEWAQTLAFDELMLPALKGDELLGESPDALKLGLQPYLVLLDLDHSVDTYFMAVRKNESGMRSEASNAMDTAPRRAAARRVTMPKKGKIWLAVHRCDNDLYFLRIEREAFLLLQALRNGSTVGTALETALAEADATQDWAAKIRAWFEQWSSLGWFCKPEKKSKDRSKKAL